MTLPSRRSARIPRVPILLLVASALTIVLASCGSSGDDSTIAGDGIGSGASVVTPSGGGMEEATKKSQGAGESDPAGGGSEIKAANSDRGKSQASGDGGSDQSQPQNEHGAPHAAGGKRQVCSKAMTRAECKSRIETQTGANQDPGAPVSAPSKCTEVMTEAQCSEILQQQKEAAAAGGKSVSPETCLDEYSREFCEEHFQEQTEQQAGQ